MAASLVRRRQAVRRPGDCPSRPKIISPFGTNDSFVRDRRAARDNGSLMNFQQLRSVREAVRCGFNLTEVAHQLHTSQPGVSRQIRELEEELGIELFVRAGKRLTGLTEPGGHV